MSLPAHIRDAIQSMGAGAEPELNKKTKAMFAPLIEAGEDVQGFRCFVSRSLKLTLRFRLSAHSSTR